MNIQAADVAVPPVLLRDDSDGIAVLTLNRPAARNSLSEELIAALHAALDAIAADARVRVVVIAAKGPVFCAGHDLKQMTARRADADGGRAYFARLISACSAMMQAIVALPKPVIAAVQGVATAAGCQLVASCDLAIASQAATFATPGVDIGLFCSTPMVALSRNIPTKPAMHMLLTGEPVGADTAVTLGLVNRAVAPGTERGEAIALARTIAGKSMTTLALGKAAFHRQIGLPLSDAYRLAGDVMVENMMTADAQEGIGAFIDKRTPRWEDR